MPKNEKLEFCVVQTEREKAFAALLKICKATFFLSLSFLAATPISFQTLHFTPFVTVTNSFGYSYFYCGELAKPKSVNSEFYLD